MSSLAPHAAVAVSRPRRPESTLLAGLARASPLEYLAAGSVTLVRAGESFGHKTVLQAVVIGIFLLAIAWAIPRQPRGSFANPRVALLLLFVANIAVALIRGAQHDTYGTVSTAGGKAVLYSAVALFGVCLITTAGDPPTRDRRLFALALTLPVYALANLALHLAGMQNPNPAGATAGTSSQLAGLIGVSSGREVFPLTTSINLYSIVVGASVAAVGVLRLRAPQWCPRWLVALVSVVCVYELLLGDSRTEIAVALGVVLLFAVFKRFKGSRWIPVVIPALPLIVIGFLHVVASTGIADALNRTTPGQNQFGTAVSGTGRVDIWQGSWHVLRHLQLQEIFGWGAGGHITSGASLQYAYVFPRDTLGYLEFTHSLPIQTVLDEGVIGLLLLIAGAWMTFSALRRHVVQNPSSPAIALVAIIVVFIACGATEVSISYYTEEALLMTLLIMGAAAGLAGRPSFVTGEIDWRPPPLSRRPEDEPQLDGAEDQDEPQVDVALDVAEEPSPPGRAPSMRSRLSRSLISRMGLMCLVVTVVGVGVIAQSSEAEADAISWAPDVTVPTPADSASQADVVITSLACPVAGSCTAIGSYQDTSGATQGLLATETGGHWTGAVQAQLPFNALSTNPDVTLTSVACASAGNCTAVGSYLDSNGLRQGLLLSETSGTWAQGREVIHPQGVASVATNPQIDLTSVACASATNCFIAGTYSDSKGYPEGLLETEINGTWSETEKNGHYSYTGLQANLPGDAGAEPDVALASVSCGAVGHCVIVGSYLNSSSEQEALLLTGTVSNGAWTFTAGAAALPAGAAASPGAWLSSVSCTASGSCSAAGSYQNASQQQQGLLVTQTGGTWQTGTTAGVPSDASSDPGVSLSSISCSSAGDCDAVGDYYTSGGNLQGLMLTATSGSWGSAAEPTLPADAGTVESVSLSSVSCYGASACAATGNYADDSFSLHPLLLSQSSNGTWSAGSEPALPYPDAAPDASVEALSCAPGGDCAEVADYTDRSNNQLAAFTSGTTVPAALPALSLSAPPSHIEIGTALAANAFTATLSGGASETGSVTFSVFGPQASPPSSCAYGGTTLSTTTVSGDGTYGPSQGFTPSSPGEYWWYASYGGDLANAPAASACGGSMHETVVQSPTITVKAPSTSPPNVTISRTALVATLSGVTADAGGSLTFTVFGPESSAPTNCSAGGTHIGSESVDGNGSLSPPGGFTPASVGDYWWYVSYTGDTSDPAAASSCGVGMTETVVSMPTPTTTTTPTTTSTTTTPTTTTPIKPPASANARIAKIMSTASGLLLTLTCPASSSGSCAGAITATATEPAGAKTKRERATKQTSERLVVTIGTATYKLAGGSSRRVSIKLNRAGTDLLRSRHKITALLKLRQGKSTISRTVTFRSPSRGPEHGLAIRQTVD